MNCLRKINEKFNTVYFLRGFCSYNGNSKRYRANSNTVAKSFADDDGYGDADAFADSDTKAIAESIAVGYADGYENADEYAVAHADTDCAGRRRGE